MTNQGAVKLAAWREQRKIGREALARIVGCRAYTIFRLERGDTPPQLRIAGAIRKATDGAVEFQDWLEEVKP